MRLWHSLAFIVIVTGYVGHAAYTIAGIAPTDRYQEAQPDNKEAENAKNTK
ncbi:MAG: hypothetical protein V3V81_07580 [Candidatus Bathyarchaeia archaeon]